MLYLAVRDTESDVFDGLHSPSEKMEKLTDDFAAACMQAFPELVITQRLDGLCALVLDLPDDDVEILAQRISETLGCTLEPNCPDLIVPLDPAPVT